MILKKLKKMKNKKIIMRILFVGSFILLIIRLDLYMIIPPARICNPCVVCKTNNINNLLYRATHRLQIGASGIDKGKIGSIETQHMRDKNSDAKYWQITIKFKER